MFEVVIIASRASGLCAYRSSSNIHSYLNDHPNIEENTNSPITMSGERRTYPSMLVLMCLAGSVANRRCTELGAEAGDVGMDSLVRCQRAWDRFQATPRNPSVGPATRAVGRTWGSKRKNTDAVFDPITRLSNNISLN